MISCPSCGSGVKFDIGLQKLKCSSCSGIFEPEIFDKTENDAEKQNTYESYVWLCPGCGAELEFSDDSDITSVCSYCGNSHIAFDKIKANRRPEKIIPFSVTKEECKKQYKKAARRAFLTSGKLKKPELIDSFKGIYMPYWSNKLYPENVIPVETMTVETSGDTEKTRIYEGTATLSHNDNAIQNDASIQFNDNISEAIQPFSSADEKDFTPGYLCGFYAETDSVDSETYSNLLCEKYRNAVIGSKIRNNETLNKSKDKIHGEETILFARITNENLETHKSLFPVWFMSYKHKNEISYYALNGSTGKIAADFPIDPIRFSAFAVLIIAVLYIIANYGGLLLRPVSALSLTTLLTLIGNYLNLRISARLSKRDFSIINTTNSNKLDDLDKCFILICSSISLLCFMINLVFTSGIDSIGVICMLGMIIILNLSILSIRRNPAKKNTILTIILMAVSLLLFETILICKPVNDMYYYMCVANSAMFVLNFVFTFIHFNKLSYRRLPQFNKRGENDNAND